MKLIVYRDDLLPAFRRQQPPCSAIRFEHLPPDVKIVACLVEEVYFEEYDGNNYVRIVVPEEKTLGQN